MRIVARMAEATKVAVRARKLMLKIEAGIFVWAARMTPPLRSFAAEVYQMLSAAQLNFILRCNPLAGRNLALLPWNHWRYQANAYPISYLISYLIPRRSSLQAFAGQIGRVASLRTCGQVATPGRPPSVTRVAYYMAICRQ